MKSFADLLLSSPFFEQFPDSDIQALAAHTRMVIVQAGCSIVREDERADLLYMLVVGKVRLSFTMPGTSPDSGAAQSGKVLIRTITEPGRVIGWSAMVEPYHYRATAIALEDCQLLAFDREWLEAHSEKDPEFGVRLMSQILWVLGNRLRETRIRLVASRYERETLAIRALLDQSASQLSVTSPLHKIPIYLESRLTLADAFQTLELLRVHGDPLEGSIARICLEILADVRKELEVYRQLQNVYEHVANAPEDVSPEEVRRRCCADFIQLYAQTHWIISGEENLPEQPGHIFIMNHLANHQDNTLPNEFQLTLDTHFVSCMLVCKKYGEPPIRVVRKSKPDEHGHQRYYDRLGYIYVYSRYVDEDENNPKLMAEQRRREFLESAASYLREKKNLVICPEGASTTSDKSPLPFRAGAFRLAAYVDPEPLLVPVVVVNFDKKITRTVLVAQVWEPIRLSEHLSKPIEDRALFDFINSLTTQFRERVAEARKLAAASNLPSQQETAG
jgi:CRP-like cAMP-binding protein/1-acyl-sn-glycerol-3-phosphate acyltransferase